jgi:hypothetical protein
VKTVAMTAAAMNHQYLGLVCRNDLIMLYP